MIFINPLEILAIKNGDVNDPILLKKSKRKLFAEIDLSEDGHLEYKGFKLTKSDCEKAIDELEDTDKKEFYLHLITNLLLNEFLTNGDEAIFRNFKQEAIYKYDKFIDFISPYFASRLDSCTFKAFKDGNTDLIKSISKTFILIKPSDFPAAYRSLDNELRERTNRIDEITDEIKNESETYNDNNIENIIYLIQEYFPGKLINSLPTYFNGQVNKIATSINYLALAVWNTFNSAYVPMKLLEIVVSFQSESVGTPIFQKNLKLFTDQNKKQIEQKEHAPVLQKWANILLKIHDIIKQVEKKEINAGEANAEVKSFLNISQLNRLLPYADEIRLQISYALRNLSIVIWNSQNDIKAAMDQINLALNVNIPSSEKNKILLDKLDLENLEKKYKGLLVCFFCEENPPDEKGLITRRIYKETSRSYFPRRVGYSYLDVNIPRCSSCKSIHENSQNRLIWPIVGFPIVGAVIVSLVDDKQVLFGLFIGLLLGIAAGISAKKKYLDERGVKNNKDSTLSRHPLLIKYFNQGWSFSQPSA